MMTKNKDANLLNKISSYSLPLKQVAPGFVLQAFHKGKKLIDINVGKTFSYYDLASLTKVIFTTSQIMRLQAKGALSLNQKVSSNFINFPFKQTSLRQLLNHSAGFKAWAPLYETIDLKSDTEAKWQDVEKLLSKQKKRKDGSSLYSDLDFFSLAIFLQSVAGKSLYEQWLEMSAPLKSRLHFNVNNIPRYKRALYAPTEKCPWRKKTLRGEVHDDNTWSLGGVSTHAGLFGRVEDVSHWALQLRKAWILQQNTSLFKSAVVNQYLKRSLSKTKGDWACGFMMPTKGAASCGDYFSNQSVGHTGFTGTSVWIDPKKDIVVTLLSNRVNPTRDNNNFKKFRPFVHNAVMEVLNA